MLLSHFNRIQNHVHDIFGCSFCKNIVELGADVPGLNFVAHAALQYKELFTFLGKGWVNCTKGHRLDGADSVLDLIRCKVIANRSNYYVIAAAIAATAITWIVACGCLAG